MPTDSQSSRYKAIQAFGGCCKSCGFSDVRALQLVNTIKGEGAKLRRSMSREKYNLLAIQDLQERPTDTPYVLLCANCSMVLKAAKGSKASGRILVWAPEVSIEVALQDHPWVVKKAMEGVEVYVLRDGVVYHHKTQQKIGSWEEFEGKMGQQIQKPFNGTIEVEL